MSSASSADLARVLQLISANDLTALTAEKYDIFQYQGFDPMKLAMSLVSAKISKGVSDADFTDDVLSMIAIGMIKGNVNDHNLAKMSEEGKKGVTVLNEKYGIKLGGGRGQAASVITYPRVMATFPDTAVKMTKVLGGKVFRGGPLASAGLPTYMLVQVFPAVIPRTLPDQAKKMLLTASLCYSLDMTIQISNMKEYDLSKLAATQSNFTMVGHQSPVPAADDRLIVFRSLPLSKDYDSIIGPLKLYKSIVDDSFEIQSRADFVKEITSIA